MSTWTPQPAPQNPHPLPYPNPNPYGRPAKQTVRYSRAPFIICGTILGVLLAILAGTSLWAWATWNGANAAVSQSRQQVCSNPNAQPTAGKDQDKVLKEARRYIKDYTLSRPDTCMMLTGEFDESTATWALNQTEGEADWNGNAVNALAQSLRFSPDQTDDTYRDMLLIKGFTEDQADYAMANKAQAQAKADKDAADDKSLMDNATGDNATGKGTNE